MQMNYRENDQSNDSKEMWKSWMLTLTSNSAMMMKGLAPMMNQSIKLRSNSSSTLMIKATMMKKVIEILTRR